MPNSYYNRTMNPQPTQRVGSNDIKSEFQSVTSGFDAVAADVARAVKLPVGTSDQTIGLSPASRANLVLAFDASGNISAISYGRWRGDWATATAYVVSDCFRDQATKNIYSTVSAHTSGVLATDIANGNVQLAINVADVEAAKSAAESAAATATTQAGLATTAASTATTQAGIATTQAGISTTGADTATTQAGIATTQAGIATTQADIATTKANEASASAAAAEAAAASISGGPVTSVNGRTGVVTGVQDALVSGATIKTIGGVSLLGSGDIDVAEQSMLALDEKASGTGGGAATIGAWTEHVINTVKTNTIAGASLASNQITLPAGRYEISAQVAGFSLGAFKARIRNITDSQTLGVGISTYAAASAVQVSEVSAAFTLSASKTIAIQYFARTASYGGDLGRPVSSAEAEVYASVLIRKIWSVV